MTPALYYRTKRFIDLAVAIPATILSLPVQAAVAAAVAAKLGRPVLFKQIRPGLHGQPFELVKFRTMLMADPARGLIDDESRLTPFGRALRATSLDELPTLWNIVRGELSLVGPRPLLVQYLDLYSDEQSRRHEVLPGLTGLAQIAGRNSLSWERKTSARRRVRQPALAQIRSRHPGSRLFRHGVEPQRRQCTRQPDYARVRRQQSRRAAMTTAS